MSGKPYVVVIGLLLAVVILLNLPPAEALRAKAGVRDNLTPFQGVVTRLLRQVRGVGWYLADAWQAPDTERRLRTENAELKRELWRMRTLQDENATLRELAEFRQGRRERLLVGEVIARGDASGWWHTVRLNRGRSDGLRPDLAVLTGRGLVGRTTVVSQFTCEVLLITDPTSQVACRAGRAGAFGVLGGGGVTFSGDPQLAMLYTAPSMEVEFLPVGASVAKGDDVVTSGLGGVFPEGIPVGKIESVRLDASQLYMNASVVPAADLRALRYVFVMLTGGAEG